MVVAHHPALCRLLLILVAPVVVPVAGLLSSQLREKVLESTAVRYSNDWAVQIQDSNLQTINTIASSHGFINMGQIGNLEGYYHFQLNVSHEAHRARTLKHLKSRSIGSLSQIIESPDLTTALNHHSSLNTGTITHGPRNKDVNVEPAWMQGTTGAGVVVAIVDDGLEKVHDDLSANFDSQASFDFDTYDYDPTPDDYLSEKPDSHGTKCAGVVAMVKNNQHCGVGVAYEANIGGIKFDLKHTSDVTESGALSHESDHIQVYSNSWGPDNGGFYVGGPGRLTTYTFLRETTQGRSGKGSIYVWAAGNGGRYYDSCAADGYSSSIYTISVGSADQTGRQADYDESCPGKMAVTFSYNSNTFPGADDTWKPYNQVSTTTLNGLCTGGFTGTSASAPIASATIALALQANPQLTWRDVQYLIAYTSNRDRLVGGDWVTNGGGLRVSPKFGFGAIDAEALVTRARRWINVPAQQTMEFPLPPLQQLSAQHGRDMVATFDVPAKSSITFLEHVVVTMTLQLQNYGVGYDRSDFEFEAEFNFDELYDWLEDPHPKRGDIQIILTSPQGTTSTLLPYRLYDFINEEGYTNWPFMSVHHWGESPVGTWTLRVTFRSSSGHVTVSGVRMQLYGTSTTPQAVSNIPAHCDSACKWACSGPGPENCDVCKELRVAESLQCVSACPKGTNIYRSYCLVNKLPNSPTTTDSAFTDSPFTHSGLTDHHNQTARIFDPTDISNSNPTDSGATEEHRHSRKIVTIAGVLGGGSVIVILGLIVVIAVSHCVRRKSRGSNYQFQRLQSDDERRPTPV